MHEIADFLGTHPPFDALTEAELERVAAATEIERHPAGTVVFAQGAGPVAHLWVVRRGGVEILHDGRVLDLLGPGELFGHASMLSGLPTGFMARVAEDAVCYRIRAEVAAPLLARPAGVRYVARSLLQIIGRGAADPPADTASRIGVSGVQTTSGVRMSSPTGREAVSAGGSAAPRPMIWRSERAT